MRLHTSILIIFLLSAQNVFSSGNEGKMNLSDDDDDFFMPNANPDRVEIRVGSASSSSAAVPPPTTPAPVVDLVQPKVAASKTKKIRAVKADKPKTTIKAVKADEIPAEILAETVEVDQPAKKPRKTATTPKNKASMPPSTASLMAPPVLKSTSSDTSVPKGPIPDETVATYKAALEERTFPASKLNKIRELGFQNFSADQAHELLLKSISHNKESAACTFLKAGWKLKLEPLDREVVTTVHSALENGKYDFMTHMLDFDPVGASKLFIYMHNNGLKHLATILKKHGSQIDPGAIKLAAETAAQAQSMLVFKVFLDSGLMLKMVSRSSLIKLFSNKYAVEIKPAVREVLEFVLKDRKLTSPFEPHLLTQAIKQNCTEFFETVLEFPELFSWDIIIHTFCQALQKQNYTVAMALLSPANNYTNPDRVFSLVSEIDFLNAVAAHATYNTMARLATIVYWEGTTLLIPDLSLMKIYLKAAKIGNFGVVHALLAGNYFNIFSRFNGKTIHRVALENGQFFIVKQLIHQGYFKVSADSDSPTVNPNGDALIYIADERNFEMFEFLLKIGADPSVRVYHEEKITSLFNWCLLKQKFKLCEILIHYGYQLNIDESRPFAQTVEAESFLMSLSAKKA